jgi:hypothetical protein
MNINKQQVKFLQENYPNTDMDLFHRGWDGNYFTRINTSKLNRNGQEFNEDGSQRRQDIYAFRTSYDTENTLNNAIKWHEIGIEVDYRNITI